MNRRPTSSLASRQAFDELQVLLRTMGSAQRRWAKDISARENNVRRLMMMEDQCRERLRQNVLRGAYTNLKYLVNTDLLTTAQVAAPPPPETFILYGIPAAQVTAFSVYAISRIWADPDRVDVPPLTLIADLQGAWSILPPTKKAAYAELAAIFRNHIESHAGEGAAKPLAVKKTTSSTQGPSAATNAIRRARARVTAAAAATTTKKTRPSQREARAAKKTKKHSNLAITQHHHSTKKDVGSWESDAFTQFVKLSRQQMRAALAKGQRLSEKEWAPIAKAEWSLKTTLQKRSYLRE